MCDRCGHDTRQVRPSCIACRTANLPGQVARMKLVLNRTIPIILPSGRNILVNMVFKISIRYTNLDTRLIQSKLGSRVCLFINSKANMVAYLYWQNFKDTLSYFSQKGCSSFIYLKRGDTKGSVKIIYVHETESLICSSSSVIAQISAVNMDAESGNIMEITISNGKTVIRLYKQECNPGSCLEFL